MGHPLKHGAVADVGTMWRSWCGVAAMAEGIMHGIRCVTDAIAMMRRWGQGESNNEEVMR